ncbi:Nicotinamide-nucleotide amidohydrolase PncC [Pseudovibrio axinellae]|uniref:Nicotinamide-nucleotide amidohydrolase PncC n=1 Tax=Pseudovibrio axinellae TaxID=989403 RepID=A0A165UNV9_9HYPH|nr:CinA family protein [Pseudovibrio axinellae]KZL12629.1 Nicotinamide-nucleotide amidohydrolase PncC [Pseudovibrio axinellae]SEP63805.1 nicotinamide-nucleotide amidase [Pseudovibrio axinellae]
MTDILYLKERARVLIARYAEKDLKIATAESCTGGLLAGLLTEVPGSSAVLDRGFVTYSNEAKHEMIGVPVDLLVSYGAVSSEVAMAMASGAHFCSNADVAISITGIAGPDGGTKDKPVGLVYFGLAHGKTEAKHVQCFFENTGRDGIRFQALVQALELLENFIENT